MANPYFPHYTTHMKSAATYMTQEGYNKIQKEYDELEAARPDYIKKLTQAADMGDRSENAAYTNAKRKLRWAESRLRFLKKILHYTTVAIPTQTEYVEIGSHVKVKLNDNEFTLHIVGLHEADPMNKKVSYKSPVGSALLNKHVGDKVKIQLEDREIEYEVVEIESIFFARLVSLCVTFLSS